MFKTSTIYFVLLWMTAQDEASTQIPSPNLTSTAVKCLKLEMLNYKTTTGTFHNIKDINSVA